MDIMILAYPGCPDILAVEQGCDVKVTKGTAVATWLPTFKTSQLPKAVYLVCL